MSVPNKVHTIRSVRLDPEWVTPSVEGERRPTQVSMEFNSSPLQAAGLSNGVNNPKRSL